MGELKIEPLTREAFEALSHADRVALEPLRGETWTDHQRRCAICRTFYAEGDATASSASIELAHRHALDELAKASASERVPEER